jgi:plasmid maintenance system antidote protein VapI
VVVLRPVAVSLDPMKSPAHPGELVRGDVLQELGLTVTKAAQMLDMSGPNLSLFLNEQIDLTPELVHVQASYCASGGRREQR